MENTFRGVDVNFELDDVVSSVANFEIPFCDKDGFVDVLIFFQEHGVRGEESWFQSHYQSFVEIDVFRIGPISVEFCVLLNKVLEPTREAPE